MSNQARTVYLSVAIDFSVRQLLGLLSSAPPEAVIQAHETIRGAWPMMPPDWQTMVSAGFAPLLQEANRFKVESERARITEMAKGIDAASAGMNEAQLRTLASTMTEEQQAILSYVVQQRQQAAPQQAPQQAAAVQAPSLPQAAPQAPTEVQNGQNSHQEAPRVEIVPT